MIIIIIIQNMYQELAKEICSMWKQKAVQVIPIVISSTGVIIIIIIIIITIT